MEICIFMICGRPPSPRGLGTVLFRPPELFQKQKLSVLNQNETKFWLVIQMVLWRTDLNIYLNSKIRLLKFKTLWFFFVFNTFKALGLTSHSAGDFYQFVWWSCSKWIGKAKRKMFLFRGVSQTQFFCCWFRPRFGREKVLTRRERP